MLIPIINGIFNINIEIFLKDLIFSESDYVVVVPFKSFISSENMDQNFTINKKGYTITTPWPGIIIKLKDDSDEKVRKKHDMKDMQLPAYIDYVNNHELQKKFRKFMFLEIFPEYLKQFWAHLTYYICIKSDKER